ENWQQDGAVLAATRISDDYRPRSYTGAFFALAAQDQDTNARWAEFDYFDYRES
ncbi:unnamed protein product, partial [Ectocarpus fasciculatus]